MKILVTGSAGFIGFHLCKQLIENGNSVVGLDNLNDYYDVNLKYGRLLELGIDKPDIHDGELLKSNIYGNKFLFILAGIEDKPMLFNLFQNQKFDAVVNLAAQAGVRYSLINPDAYIQSNIIGFLNILEACRNFPVSHLVFASSSSVYGKNLKMPFAESDKANHVVSLYAATKKSNELMAHSYSHLFKIPITGLRFFTVYGPWGRPDMAPFLFTEAIAKHKPIKVFNYGNMNRDFTYVEDVVDGIVKVINQPAIPDPKWIATNPDPSTSDVPFRIYNIGNDKPEKLSDFIEAIEINLGIKAIKEMLPMQPGDVVSTHASIEKLKLATGYYPQTSMNDGVKKFVKWFIDYYK